MDTNLNYLITGASGYLGNAIIAALHARGCGRIIALDLCEEPRKLDGVRYVSASVVDLDALTALTKDVDVVFHCASVVPLRKSARGFREVNVGGTGNVVEACRRNRVGMLVHISSSAIYGIPKDDPITPATQYAPIEAYGVSKLDAERQVWRYMDEGGAAACLRPRTIVGGERLGIFQILFEWISEGRRIYVIGDGSNRIQLLHLDDMVDAALLAAGRKVTGLFNVGGGEFGTLREDLGALIRHAGTASTVAGLPAWLAISTLRAADLLRLSPLAPWHYMTYHKSFVFDIEHTKAALGWTPRFGNVQALTNAYDRYITGAAAMPEVSGSVHRSAVKQRLIGLIKRLS